MPCFVVVKLLDFFNVKLFMEDQIRRAALHKVTKKGCRIFLKAVGKNWESLVIASG